MIYLKILTLVKNDVHRASNTKKKNKNKKKKLLLMVFKTVEL